MPSVFADVRGLALAAIAVVAVVPAGALAPLAERPSGAIAFVREEGPRREAWVMRADGTGEHAIDEGPWSSYPASVAPNGALAILRAEETGDRHEESLVVEGHVLARGGLVRNPSWVADGSAIVFESDRASFRDLFRVARTGGEFVRLTANEEGNYEPAPNGRGIVFTSSRDGEAEIYRMGADGQGPERLTRSPGDDLSPRPSPDGNRIAFISGRDGADHVFVMDANGANQRRVRHEASGSSASDEEREHTWSSDGRKLAFVARAPRGKARVFVWDAERDVAAPITDGTAIADMPAFSPDGRFVAYVSDDGSGPDLYVARADGSGAARIGRSRAKRWRPLWMP